MATKPDNRSPESIMRRAQLWGEVFAAKDQGKVIKVQVMKPVRGGYMVELPWGLVGFLHCYDRELPEGHETEARITVADYVSKEIKLKPIRDKGEVERALSALREAHAKGSVVKATLRSIVRGGFLVDIMGIKAFLPSSHTSITESEARGILGKAIPVKLLKVSKKGSVVSHKKAIEEGGEIGKEAQS
ncbi:MAG: S1 RNA-binding domain-containing protein [candidate division WOR-3 bacterium]